MSKLGKISFLFAGISLLLLSIMLYLAGGWVPFCWVALICMVFLSGLSLYLDRKFFSEFLRMKTTKEGLNMGSLIGLFLAFLVVINFLGVKHSITFDFSIGKTNSLSEQSIQLAKNLGSDLKVLFFYKRGVEGNEENRRSFRELIKKYQDYNSRIQLEFVEMNERPDLSHEYGVDKGSGVAFLDYLGRRNRIEKIDEQEFTSALVKVTREKIKTIYFTVGHGEKNIDESKEAEGLNSLKLMLENNRYKVKTLPLIQSSIIPEDANVLVIVGPTQAFEKFEVEAIEDYLKKGGSLFVALDPQFQIGFEKIFSSIGIELANNYVVDVVETVLGRGVKQGPTVGSVFSRTNQITKSFDKNDVTLFRYPQSMKKITNSTVKEGLQFEILVSTSSEAEAFDNISLKGNGVAGSYPLVSEIKGKWNQDDNGRIFQVILAGDVDFLTNQMLYQHLNRDLVLNSMASLAKEESLISITTKEPEATELRLNDTNFSIFILGFIIPFPLLLLGVSIGLYTKRRNA